MPLNPQINNIDKSLEALKKEIEGFRDEIKDYIHKKVRADENGRGKDFKGDVSKG